MKKLTTIILILAIMFTNMILPVNAVDSTSIVSVTNANEISVPILAVPNNLSEEDALTYIAENNTRSIFVGSSTFSLVRLSADSERCTLWMHWSGELASAYRYKLIEITSNSLLFTETYDTSGNGVSYMTATFPASSSANVRLAVVNIPVDVSSVTLQITSGQIFINSSASWVSGAKSRYTSSITN